MKEQALFHLVLGLGQTGYSCTKFLAQKNIPVAVMDNRLNPPYAERLTKEFPHIPQYLGAFSQEQILSARRLVVSPGIPLTTPEIVTAIARGIPVVGDIELFAEHCQVPIIGITGTNGKSTVTTLVGHMLKAAGYNACVAGNIGVSVLEELEKNPPCFVLELSSFQLETTQTLQPQIATILNLSEDHMDRYQSYQDYINAKKRIYQFAQYAVCFADQPLTYPDNDIPVTEFTFAEPKENQWGLRTIDSQTYLAYGCENIIATNALRIRGKQNWANALSAAAIAHKFGADLASIAKALGDFTGLQHRCQWIRSLNDVDWYNDSKGTNVGASIAAIQGIGETIVGQIILIAGGQGKGADFSLLGDCFQHYVKHCILIGEDANKIMTATPKTKHVIASDLKFAVNQARDLANPGDVVLLSPACASFDMFKNFEHRGNCFVELVQELK